MADSTVTIVGNVLSDVMVNVHLDHARGVVISGNTFWTAYEHNLLVEHSSYVTVGANNFDRKAKKLDLQYRIREKLPRNALSSMQLECPPIH